ncbi:cation diffusion facilitator family transporter [Ferrimonas balearica DSM 9799]|uniref:Cation-efflux pump FieF n=1 Tax=Ferrimonas balearica (strain DSM 9799 / CCM 4581 / KCTC 23876 / PAT) TaxID=550540 RepID=E1SW01_FERBD|nr:cation diffusion facilitator family transporter [Ferrimonas balearica]ADN74301.1 cation diffusion facilitator family transporter [Ferrimonas balearica DSM 9799]MBY5981942.1 cation diffusion facilitator family transporter [Ferrimonas balearica]
MSSSTTPEQYAFWIRVATRASVATAVILILAKLLAWSFSGSASLLASLTDSMMDAMASLVNFYALRVALLPADQHHRFGHGKAEPLATLVQAGFILGSALLLLFHGSERLINPTPLTNSTLGIGVSVFAMVATVVLLTIQKRAVAVTGSTAIAADALHYRTDLLLNAAVLLALVLASQGLLWADGLFAVLIALYIGYGAWGLGSEAVQLLLDREAEPEVREQVEALAKADPGVQGLHDLRTRRSGNTLYVQMHLELDGDLPLREAHDLADAVECRIREAFPGADVIVHQDPV